MFRTLNELMKVSGRADCIGFFMTVASVVVLLWMMRGV